MKFGRFGRGGFGGSWRAERTWYLEREKGRLRTDGPAEVKVALGFPNRYPVGMSNLGFQVVYKLLNRLEGIVCERTFLWDTGGSKTLESGRSLDQFDIVAFSVSFELDYLNLLEILRRAQIPLLASERGSQDPIIMVGGPCAFLNPEPLAPFVDLFVVGEGEDVIPPLMEIAKVASSREEILDACLGIAGVYIPRLYSVSYLPGGRIAAMRAHRGAPRRITRQWLDSLDGHQTSSPVLTPLSHFKEMCLIEVQRGCPYNCRFCAMGLIYRPLRHRSIDALRVQIEDARKMGGRIGLVGSAVADLPGIEELCLLLSSGEDRLGISSLRADRLTPRLLNELAALGMRTVTIAPEVATERMRQVINKSVTTEDVLRTAGFVAEAGISRMKLYFIIGLPGERDRDIAAIPSLVREIRQTSNLKTISISVSIFVPKAATPFQWARMEGETTLRRKFELLRKTLRPLKGVIFAAESPRNSMWQGLLAMGDRRVGEVLWHHLAEGLTWARCWRKVGVDRDFFIYRQKDLHERLPGDIIDHGVQKKKLWSEYVRALKAAV